MNKTRLLGAVCGFALFAGTVSAQPVSESPKILVQYDETTLSKDSVTFQRGVFRVEEAGLGVTMLCIPVEGQWKKVGTMSDCGNPPPPALQREIRQFSPDQTFLGIRNLGITSKEWDIAQKMVSSGSPGNALSSVGEAFYYVVGSSDVRWRLDSRKLPEQLKTPIPGSGIHVDFGGLFSSEHKLPLFDSGGGDFEVEARLSVPTLARSGKARSGLTLAVDLAMKSETGNAVAMAVIVSLVNRDAGRREVIRSDGRSIFASTYLAPGNRYIQQVENHERSASWSGLGTFAFKLTRENMKHILADANARRRAAGMELLDESNLDKIRVSGVTLRNESRFLDQGDVTIEVIVDYLQVIRGASSG